MPHAFAGIEIVTVPCLDDNYAFLIKGPGPGEVAVVDAPEAAPIEAALDARGWSPGAVLLTHHHADHTAGVERLRARYDCRIVGPAAEADRLPPLDRRVVGGDTGGSGPFRSVVIAVPGHTNGHVAYHFPQAAAVFTGDSLMAGGCGRLFEGTAAQMHHSLCRLAALPPLTLIYSGHEYTASNLRFALSLDPDNAALISRYAAVVALRQAGRPTVPGSLRDELATNPFLRAGTDALKTATGMQAASEAAVFAEIRALKDRF